MEEVLVDRAAEDAARVRLNRPEVENALAAGLRVFPAIRISVYKGR
jgi:enoyl-CoA hydratase/carnithine racemase